MTAPTPPNTNPVMPVPVEMNQVRDQILLVVPARPEMWAVVRMTASAIASRLDFSFEGIEDLRLAVTELCSSCSVDAEPSAKCEIRFEVSTDRLEMNIEVAPVTEDIAQPTQDRGMTMLELSEQILLATVDSHAIEPIESGVRHGYLRKDCDAVAPR
jgi:serine/threonine-protein kinase RsbW